MKKFFLSFMAAMFLFTAMPKKEAKAGIILAPAGVGIVLIVLGAIYHDGLLLFLDDETATSVVASELQARYGKFTSNVSVFNNLADKIIAKTPANLVEKMEIALTEEEIFDALGSAAANDELVAAVTADLM